jgi:hypothetical protein
MGISIIGYSNVNVTIYKNIDTADDIDVDDDYIHYDYKNNLIYSKSDNTKRASASRSYSGCESLMRMLYKYANSKGIEINMIEICYDGLIVSNDKTSKAEKFLNEVYYGLCDEDETELEEKYGITGWDVEFTGHLYEALVLCNQLGIILFL